MNDRRTTKPSRRAAALFGASSLLTALSAFPQAETPDAAAQALDLMVVTATRNDVAFSEAPASVTIITSEQIDLRRNARIGDVLAEVPGLYLRNNAKGAQFPSSGQASIAIRGVPRTTRTLVMIDGQPINSALSGGIDLSSIMLDNVRRIEVVRGPYSALYGGNAMGGVIHVLTRTPTRREFQGRLESGFGDVSSSAASIVYRDKFASGFAWSIALGYRASDGWHDSDYVVKTAATGAATLPVAGAIATTTTDGRPAAWLGVKGERPWDQRNAELKLIQDMGEAGRATLNLAFAGYRVGYRPPDSFLANAAGGTVLSGSIATGLPGISRIALVESDFFTLTPSSERDWRGAFRWERDFASGVHLVANLGHMDHNFRFTQPGAGAGLLAGPGEWSDQPNQRTDADAYMRWNLDEKLAMTVGAAVNHQRLNRRTLAASAWREYRSSFSENGRGSGTSEVVAAFAQGEYQPFPGLTLHTGVRIDRFSTHGEVRQNTAPAFVTAYPARSEHQLSPKIAAVWSLTRRWTVRASFGTGFRPPTLLDLYTRTVAPTTVAGTFSINEPAPDLKAERIRAAEIGIDYQSADGTSASAACFSQRLSDLVYRSRRSATLTQSANAGNASVDGLELSLRRPMMNRQLTAFATASWLSRYAITENVAIPASVGRKLTDVPGKMFSAGVEFTSGPWSGSLAASRVGHIFGSGDDTNINVVQGVYGSYDAHTLVNAKVSYLVTANVSIGVSIDNLTNRQYFDFYKQPGVTGLAEVVVRF